MSTATLTLPPHVLKLRDTSTLAMTMTCTRTRATRCSKVVLALGCVLGTAVPLGIALLRYLLPRDSVLAAFPFLTEEGAALPPPASSVPGTRRMTTITCILMQPVQLPRAFQGRNAYGHRRLWYLPFHIIRHNDPLLSLAERPGSRGPPPPQQHCPHEDCGDVLRGILEESQPLVAPSTPRPCLFRAPAGDKNVKALGCGQ